MSIVASVVKHMKAAGCSLEQIGAVAAALTENGPSSDDERRRRDRERKAAARGSSTESPQKIHGRSADVPADISADIPLETVDSRAPIHAGVLCGEELEREEERKKKEISSLRSEKALAAKIARREADEAIVDAFDANFTQLAASYGLPVTRAMSEPRRRAILARADDLVKVFGFADAGSGFADLLARIRGSPFLLGKNDRDWKVDLDWLVKEANFLKVMEGKYAPKINGSGNVRQFAPAYR